ncbi:arginine-glutamic acid dipeptide repeats protein-like [Leptopilina boulardi]|uniref:arginine-glutamic acid dipeptide repeats protein-like n=1 Tax=Leptopilina boulardi TaxID=63433 RepID=UPI0021F59305|nr:arginine-glutamic acid dipeptide repeats protein-like [Leptopilina boulardi]
MAYRGVKGSDPFVSKTSRNERFAQMSKQEQIIQQKKLEIQAKLEEQKARQAIENAKKSTSSASLATTSKTNTSNKKEDEKPTMTATTVNLFANDGSFLDQFKKIVNNKGPIKQETTTSTTTTSPQIIIKTEPEKKDERNKDEKDEKSYDNNSRDRERRWSNEKSRDWENRRDRRRNDSRWSGRNTDRRQSSSLSPSPTRHRTSPNSDTRHNYHHQTSPRSHYNQFQSQNTNSTSNIPPLMSQPIMQMTNIPPPNLRNIPPQNIPPPNIQQRMPMQQKPNQNNFSNIENHPSDSRMSLPPPSHIIRTQHQMQNLPPPPNTNIPPPQTPQRIQMQSNIPVPNIQGMPSSNTNQHIISPPPPPPPPPSHIPPPNNLHQPPNIPPPNVRPPPNLLPSMSQMPPNMLPINQTQTIVVTVANVTNIPPPNVMIMSAPPPSVVHTVPSTINSIPPPNLNIPPPNVPPPAIIQNAPPPSHLLQTSYPLANQVNIAVGPPPNVQIPPPVRPSLSGQPTELVCPVEAEQLAKIVADCGDEIEQEVREKNAQDPKLWFLHQKQSAAYLQYRGLVAKYRAEKESKYCGGGDLYCPEEALSDNDDAEKSHNKNSSLQDRYKEESKEERKRKRRSRWGDAENKIPLTMSGQVAQPGVSVTGQIGQNSGLMPSVNLMQAKGKNPMLSKVSRSDPSLVQYARQTFGSLDLSEEQWKKAEDHFKINLLYQNLLKKREEVKRLEAQGKHKYEYDSDEETEGGTWEHKIRSAEMEATQMWAEELTAQSEGKHHIGDFLPPEELRKFMEQYNAVKQGKEPDLSDYKEYKLKEDNIGFQMLQKLGWSEGQGLGSEGSGRVDPVNKATNRLNSAGLGTDRPDGLSRDDDEFDAYRKRMMLAYRFRPNPLNNPRRPYY